jgi:hypothetical protein
MKRGKFREGLGDPMEARHQVSAGSANEKAARNMSSGPPGSKLIFPEMQPAPVITDCPQRGRRANSKMLFHRRNK